MAGPVTNLHLLPAGSDFFTRMAFSFFAKHRSSCPKNGFHSDLVQFPYISMGLSSLLEVYFSISSNLRFWGIPWYTIFLYPHPGQRQIHWPLSHFNVRLVSQDEPPIGGDFHQNWDRFMALGNPDSPIFDGRFPIFDGALMLGLHIFDGGFRIGSQGYIPFLGHFFIQHPVFWHHLAIPRRSAAGITKRWQQVSL